MIRSALRSQRLIALFLASCALFNYPLLAIFTVPAQILGFPLLYAYIFTAWLGVIILIAWLAESGVNRSRKEKSSSPE